MLPSRMTLNDLCAAYVRFKLLKPDTVLMYRTSVKSWLNHSDIEYIDEVTEDAVIDWRNLRLRTVRRTTWNMHRRHLRALFNFAMHPKRAWVTSNPFKEVPPAPEPGRLPKTVEVPLLDQVMTLLTRHRGTSKGMAPRWFWGIVVRTFFFTGLRRSQLPGIRWKDLHLNEKYLLLRYETSKTLREWPVPLHDDLIQDFEYLERRTRDVLGRAPLPDEQVFNGTLFNLRYEGSVLTPDHITRFFQDLTKELGTPISAHRLRHTMATHLAPTGQLKSLQDVLGHTNIKTTMGYIHPDVAQLGGLVSHLPSLRPIGRSC